MRVGYVDSPEPVEVDPETGASGRSAGGEQLVSDAAVETGLARPSEPRAR